MSTTYLCDIFVSNRVDVGKETKRIGWGFGVMSTLRAGVVDDD